MIQNFNAHRWFLWTSLPFLMLQAVFSLIWHTPSVNLPFHDTYYVISQSQILMLLAAFFVFLAVIYFVFLKMRRHLHSGLSVIHYILTMLSIIILIFGMVFSGFFIKSDNENADAILFDYKSLNQAIAISAFLLIFGQIIFIINCLFSIFTFSFFRKR